MRRARVRPTQGAKAATPVRTQREQNLMTPHDPTAAVLAVASLNWAGGWSLVLAGFASGAGLGLGFHRPGFLGGYGSLRRRLTRLGHIALIALGILNLLFALLPPGDPELARIAGALWLAGGLAMPTVCFLTAWRLPFRHAFALPVVLLVAAAATTLIGGSS